MHSGITPFEEPLVSSAKGTNGRIVLQTRRLPSGHIVHEFGGTVELVCHGWSVWLCVVPSCGVLCIAYRGDIDLRLAVVGIVAASGLGGSV